MLRTSILTFSTNIPSCLDQLQLPNPLRHSHIHQLEDAVVILKNPGRSPRPTRRNQAGLCPLSARFNGPPARRLGLQESLQNSPAKEGAACSPFSTSESRLGFWKLALKSPDSHAPPFLIAVVSQPIGSLIPAALSRVELLSKAANAWPACEAALPPADGLVKSRSRYNRGCSLAIVANPTVGSKPPTRRYPRCQNEAK